MAIRDADLANSAANYVPEKKKKKKPKNKKKEEDIPTDWEGDFTEKVKVFFLHKYFTHLERNQS